MTMKRILTILAVVLLSYGAAAQVTDAFEGVLPVTDGRMMKCLNGEWQLKVMAGIDDRTIPAVDGTWGRIKVPGCWEAYGFCKPTYNYPDSLTGWYRTAFTVPSAWKGQQVYIRLDGVLRGYDLWVNDKFVGSWESAYNTRLFNLTPYLTKHVFKGEQQQLAMRVYSRFKGYEFDCFDDWTPMGIFRDVTLMAVPKTHLSDLTIRTRNSGEVMVSTEIANGNNKTVVKHEIFDAQGGYLGTDKVVHPRLWTAETPYLYTLRTTLMQHGKPLQTFEHKFGFRELTVRGNVLLLNGKPIKLRGVTAHATDPKTVKVVSEQLTLHDMKLMKEASVNYIRTSHYPREPRFYELADSLGFYVIDEVPFGFGDKHLSDSSYYGIMQQRAQATVRRDKNHPSVLIWSLGNENPLTEQCQKLGEYVKRELDSLHPICYPQVGSYFCRFKYDFPKVADIYAPHYPTTSQIDGFYQQADRPVIFTEYCHSLGISFEDHDRQWEIIERTPCIAGGSVWEWVDQGMPFHGEGNFSKWRTDGSEQDQKVYTSEQSGFEMQGNYGTDGLLYADRTPLPNYYELQHNYARAFATLVSSDADVTRLSITNRYDFLNLKDHVTFHWALTNDRDTILHGAFSPDCAPHSTVPYDLQITGQKGLSLLLMDIEDTQGHTFLHQSFVLNKPHQNWIGQGSPMTMIQEKSIRAGRKPTMAEHIKQKGRLPMPYLLPVDNLAVKAEILSEEQMDGGQRITFTLAPDTADVFRAEMGLAYLLDASIDRVQWIGKGPFATYPGRRQANSYGFWAKQMDDLYFEGNRMGVDAAYLSDSTGQGLLIVGDSLNLNFEQTDRGIVVTVNAAVAGQGPKFARTAFPIVVKDKIGASFSLYRIEAGQWPSLFADPQSIPLPFRPFFTQYDTYLLRCADIKQER